MLLNRVEDESPEIEALIRRAPHSEAVAPSRPQNPSRFRKSSVRILQVHQAKGAGHRVEALVREGKLLRVTFLESKTGIGRACSFDHRCGKVESLREGPSSCRTGDELACTAGNVEKSSSFEVWKSAED